MNKLKTPINDSNGFNYTLVKATNSAFLFKVECRGSIFYEVLENSKTLRLITNSDSAHNQAWKWTSYNFQSALKKFNQLNKWGSSNE